jgi:hypothetical protein
MTKNRWPDPKICRYGMQAKKNPPALLPAGGRSDALASDEN